MQQKDPSAMHRGLMEGTGNRLQSIGAKRVAGGDLYQLPFELTEEEKASLSATKEQMAQSFKRAFPPPYARAAA
ncbi:hypothetical protein AXE65_12770 [Ventosimonas gracilis]|uniref:Uncharacterized protein n=2 Tax=Ventosimonas gracilis TaxID=1680762 RepID=A0A139SVT3_9GAMM|nr:hypothetical protein AXE65_12770 [Ventosimonas gracilis]